jgi:hypothetical protein
MALTNSPDVCAPRTARSRPECPPIAHVAPSSCGMPPLHGGQGLFASGLARCRPYGMDTDAPVQTQETKRESKDVMAPPRIRAQSIPSRVGHRRVWGVWRAGNCFCGRYSAHRRIPAFPVRFTRSWSMHSPTDASESHSLSLLLSTTPFAPYDRRPYRPIVGYGPPLRP